MRFKNSKYTFRCNEDVKEEFKMFCKIANVSPADVLQDVMIEFNENAKKISRMKDVIELRELLEDKMKEVSCEIRKIGEHPTFEK